MKSNSCCQGQRIGIAGAGLMGRLLAWQLVKQGCHVSLFDQSGPDDEAAAAFVAAGMLAPYAELETAESSVFQLGMQSLAIWPQLIASLQAEHLFCTGGTLVVAHPQDQAYLQRFRQQLQHHHIDAAKTPLLDRRGLSACNESLGERFTQALSLPDESWVYSRELLELLQQRLLDAGVTWHFNCAVTAAESRLIRSSRGDEAFDWVVDCRGLGAKPQWPQLRGVRGEVLEVHAPEVDITQMVRLMHPQYRLYLVPRDNHHYLLGATQIESEDPSNISVRSALELLSALYSLHPGFAEARIVRTATGCRPALPDHLPAIEQVPGLLRINGLYRHGFLLAPAMAERAMDYIHREQI